MIFVFDYDLIAYKAASACEDTSIKVTFKKTGSTKVFKNRETFYGRKNNIKGWLGDQNSNRKVPLTLDDFEIEDLKNPTDVETMKRVINGMIQNILKKLDYNEFSDTYYGYLGKGETFRHKLATLLPYKGNRNTKPILLNDAKKHIERKHAGEFVEDLEADDVVAKVQAMSYLKYKETLDDDDKVIVITVDKDSMGVPGFVFNPDKPDQGVIEIDGFGELFLDGKDKVRGKGRLFNYFQILYGDPVDNYLAAAHSKYRWGPKSAYSALCKCKDDKEALQAIVDSYKFLYPDTITITNFRNEEIVIDWKYVLNEIVQLATMQFIETEVSIFTVLDRYGVEYE